MMKSNKIAYVCAASYNVLSTSSAGMYNVDNSNSDSPLNYMILLTINVFEYFLGIITALKCSHIMTSSHSTEAEWPKDTKPVSVWKTLIALMVKDHYIVMLNLIRFGL